jgi:hypothetical protein
MNRTQRLDAATNAARKAVRAAESLNADPGFVADLKLAERVLQEAAFCARLCADDPLDYEAYSRLVSFILEAKVTINSASMGYSDCLQYVNENSMKEPT